MSKRCRPRQANSVDRNAVAEVILRSRSILTLDPFTTNPRMGRFVLIQDYEIRGGGIIGMGGYPDQRRSLTVKSENITYSDHHVRLEGRWSSFGHKSGILWFTGLSGAGKTTLGLELENLLFQKGYKTYLLDGDNIRHGLNADLGFSPEDRAENIRRIGQVARLFADAGLIVITAFISPYRSDRDRVRQICGDLYHEIFIDTPLAVCETRDAKGLYAKARRGEIRDFTGVTSPYEPPDSPELVIDNAGHGIKDNTERLLDYARKVFAL